MTDAYGDSVRIVTSNDFGDSYTFFEIGGNESSLWGAIFGGTTGEESEDIITSIHVGGFCGE